MQKTMADKTSQNMDEGNTHANSVNKDLDSEDDDNEPEEMNPAVPHGLDRAVQVQSTHKAATNKLKILVQEMTALMQAHGLPTISYTYVALFLSLSLSLALSVFSLFGPLLGSLVPEDALKASRGSVHIYHQSNCDCGSALGT